MVAEAVVNVELQEHLEALEVEALEAVQHQMHLQIHQELELLEQ